MEVRFDPSAKLAAWCPSVFWRTPSKALHSLSLGRGLDVKSESHCTHPTGGCSFALNTKKLLRVLEGHSFPSRLLILRWRKRQSVRRARTPVTNWPHAALCFWQRFLCCSFPAFTDMTSWNTSRVHSWNISTNNFMDVKFVICLYLS